MLPSCLALIKDCSGGVKSTRCSQGHFCFCQRRTRGRSVGTDGESTPPQCPAVTDSPATDGNFGVFVSE
eukprot:7147335-Prorocentrum_lima.AAC.1